MRAVRQMGRSDMGPFEYGWKAGSLLPLALFVLCCFSSCDDKSPCIPVCERPFDLAKAHANQRVSLLRKAPGPWPELAEKRYRVWRETHAAQRDAYVSKCIAVCSPERVLCQKRSINISEWTACGQ